MAVTHYRDLVVWQKSIDLAEVVYKLTQRFPQCELYGLTNQLRRAVVSIASNIAEGQGRGMGNEFIHFLRIANGSRQEVETQLIIAARLQYITTTEADPILAQIAELGRLLSGLLRSLPNN
jgi:four helix bundle protein